MAASAAELVGNGGPPGAAPEPLPPALAALLPAAGLEDGTRGPGPAAATLAASTSAAVARILTRVDKLSVEAEAARHAIAAAGRRAEAAEAAAAGERAARAALAGEFEALLLSSGRAAASGAPGGGAGGQPHPTDARQGARPPARAGWLSGLAASSAGGGSSGAGSPVVGRMI
jgi:hypothetical protein